MSSRALHSLRVFSKPCAQTKGGVKKKTAFKQTPSKKLLSRNLLNNLCHQKQNRRICKDRHTQTCIHRHTQTCMCCRPSAAVGMAQILCVHMRRRIHVCAADLQRRVRPSSLLLAVLPAVANTDTMLTLLCCEHADTDRPADRRCFAHCCQH